jgi:hypothetical protein
MHAHSVYTRLLLLALCMVLGTFLCVLEYNVILHCVEHAVRSHEEYSVMVYRDHKIIPYIYIYLHIKRLLTYF